MMLRLAPVIYCLVACSLAGCGEAALSATQPIATVTGAICDSSQNRFVPGARVRLLEHDVAGKLVHEQQGETDDEGKFTFTPVRNGSHKIVADKAAFQTELAVDVRANRDVALPIPSCTYPLGSFKGRVCDQAEGKWLEGATVTVQGPTGMVSAPVPTSVLGEFSLSNVPAGQRRITATKDGKVITYDVRIPADSEGDLGIADCVTPGLSNVEGQICANEAGIWLAGATVSVQASGTTFATETALDGQFVLRGLPPGSYELSVKKGAFSTKVSITTEANKTSKLGAPLCTPSNIPIAVVSGNFDATQKVLTRLKFSNLTIYKGYIAHNDIKDMPANFDGNWVSHLLDGASPGIFQYRIVVFNSGLETEQLGDIGSVARNQRLQTLRRYVQEGGRVYLSDWAYELIAGGFGSPIDFYGNDDVPDTVHNAGIQTLEGARIADTHLQQLLGGDRVDLEISSPDTVVINDVQDDATVYMTADIDLSVNGNTVTNSPLLVSFPIGSGNVVYTTLYKRFAVDSVVDKVLTFLIFEL